MPNTKLTLKKFTKAAQFRQIWSHLEWSWSRGSNQRDLLYDFWSAKFRKGPDSVQSKVLPSSETEEILGNYLMTFR